jgi:hypothetical protein
VTGDFEIETYVNMPQGRHLERHFGIAIVQELQGGAPPHQNLDLSNLVMFGLFHPDLIHFMVAQNNGFYDNVGVGGQTGTSYYLRMTKLGSTFTGYFRTDPGQPWVQAGTITNPAITRGYVGFLGKSWGGPKDILPADYEYFRLTPLVSTGTFESRVHDMGVTGLTPALSVAGANLDNVTLQFRGADTPGELAALPYVGPDGTSATAYSGTYTGWLTAGLSGKRYFQYRAVLPSGTTLSDVALVGQAGVILPFTQDDVRAVLRMAGGLQAVTPADLARYDVVGGSSAGRVDLMDAAHILRSINN